ncbi:DUF3623 domain-containing protein [Roseovarius sp. LXJ103]|uniref:putative photosynthetic complex assembly protein PuhE n=1 Tax=Roseovarius carneus TaxID=2853164 RepID=UPI000D605390|nr:putative photosynthetic complex assembly protein PuhE [Roseovarius carneus]MBZ8119156.1 DUF3623 domain-containing protein [Roseovarius carneus]PWE35211.1 hypothetical protein DD563_04065 [Pelagicola sp. LXJ1103]
MTTPWIAALFALFVWWFATGVILLVVRRADRAGGHAHGRSVLFGTPVLALGFALLIHSVENTSVAGAYTGFLAALAIWGWIELTFLTGLVTGPTRAKCPAHVFGLDRLWRGWSVVAHHEALLLVGLLVMVLVCHGAANPMALWAYLVLFGARILAKLNLFFGVPRINTEFVPRPLEHIKSYFRRGPITLAFPVAITALSLLTGGLVHQLWTADTGYAQITYALLSALAALALLEHWLMVVPLPDAKLWRWMLPTPRGPQIHSAHASDDTNGKIAP